MAKARAAKSKRKSNKAKWAANAKSVMNRAAVRKERKATRRMNAYINASRSAR